MTGQQEFWVVILTCRHTLEFSVSPPQNGDRVWCPRCDDYRYVRKAPDEWKVRCRGCIMSRRHGRNEHAAWAQAIRHKRKQPSHRVEIWNGRKLVHVVTTEGQQTLDYSGPPPF